MARKIDKDTPLSRNQRLIADNYGSGEFSYCKTVDEALDVGDGLFAFLLTELSEDEDCENYAEAFTRLDTIKREIDEIQNVFANADDYRRVVKDNG